MTRPTNARLAGEEPLVLDHVARMDPFQQELRNLVTGGVAERSGPSTSFAERPSPDDPGERPVCAETPTRSSRTQGGMADLRRRDLSFFLFHRRRLDGARRPRVERGEDHARLLGTRCDGRF